MKTVIKTLALAVFITAFSSGVAAACDASKGGCCAKCECCKDKDDGAKPAPTPPVHRQ